MNCREKAGTEIVVKIFVFAHVVHLLPLSLGHLLLHQFWSHLLLIRIKTTILKKTSDHQQHPTLGHNHFNNNFSVNLGYCYKNSIGDCIFFTVCYYYAVNLFFFFVY